MDKMNRRNFIRIAALGGLGMMIGVKAEAGVKAEPELYRQVYHTYTEYDFPHHFTMSTGVLTVTPEGDHFRVVSDTGGIFQPGERVTAA